MSKLLKKRPHDLFRRCPPPPPGPAFWCRRDQARRWACGAVQALGGLAGIVQQVLPRPLLAGPPRKAGTRCATVVVGRRELFDAFWGGETGLSQGRGGPTEREREPPRFGGPRGLKGSTEIDSPGLPRKKSGNRLGQRPSSDFVPPKTKTKSSKTEVMEISKTARLRIHLGQPLAQRRRTERHRFWVGRIKKGQA